MEFAPDQRGSAEFDFLSLEGIGGVFHHHGNVSVLDFRYRYAIPFVRTDESNRKFFPIKRIFPVFDGKGDQATFDFHDTGGYPS